MPGRESQDRGTMHLSEEVRSCLGRAGLEAGGGEGLGLWRIGGTVLAMPFLFILPPEWDGRKGKWVRVGRKDVVFGSLRQQWGIW